MESSPRIALVGKIKFELCLLVFGRILVRDVVHWIRVAETSKLPVLFASVASLAISFVSESIFWNLAEKKQLKKVVASKNGLYIYICFVLFSKCLGAKVRWRPTT